MRYSRICNIYVDKSYIYMACNIYIYIYIFICMCNICMRFAYVNIQYTYICNIYYMQYRQGISLSRYICDIFIYNSYNYVQNESWVDGCKFGGYG